MVSEKIIESVIDGYLSDESAFIDDMTKMVNENPSLFAFVTQESNDILTEPEKDLLWYITVVIFSSVNIDMGERLLLTEEALSSAEEINWESLQAQPKGSFREKITPLYIGYAQEDLLAFVEDSIELDEESPITTVGRDVIFITAKSIIDTIHKLK